MILSGKLISFAIFLLFTCSACREVILHDLEESKANQIIVMLNQAAIYGFKISKGGKWNIAVRSDQVVVALGLLEKSRLTHRDLMEFKEEPKGILSSKEERIRYAERQLAWDIKKTIEAIPGVLEAHLHFNVEETKDLDFNEDKKNRSASALVLSNGKPSFSEGQIRTIIAGASGTRPEAISVIIAVEEAIPERLINTPDLPRKVTNQNYSFFSIAKETKKKLSLKVKLLISIAATFFIFVIYIFLNKRRKIKTRAKERKLADDLTNSSNSFERTNNEQSLEPGEPISTMHAYKVNLTELFQ